MRKQADESRGRIGKRRGSGGEAKHGKLLEGSIILIIYRTNVARSVVQSKAHVVFSGVIYDL